MERKEEDLALQNPSRSLWPQCPAKAYSYERKRFSLMQYLESLIREKSGGRIIAV